MSTTKTQTVNTTTVVKKCTCKSEYQDKMYGAGMRVMNGTSPKMGAGFRCTVCRAKIN